MRLIGRPIQIIQQYTPRVLREPIEDLVHSFRDERALQRYSRKPFQPPPHGIKARAVCVYAKQFGLKVLVETGTFRGAMVQKCIDQFEQIISIELSVDLHERATRRFSRFPQVTLLQGDSGVVLPEVVRTLRVPALYWLDGHYSSGETACGDRETPLTLELRALSHVASSGSVILIDDARLLGTGDYPTLGEVVDVLPAYAVQIVEDIVCATPKVRS